MKDFIGNKLNIGDTIGQVIHGRTTDFKGKKTIFVSNNDIIKSSPKFK